MDENSKMKSCACKRFDIRQDEEYCGMCRSEKGMRRPNRCACGTIAMHMIGVTRLCCKCYVMAGNHSASWHFHCMLAYQRVLGIKFKILEHDHFLNCPESIEWEIIEPFERFAIVNHEQSLFTLNVRDGLSPIEIYWVMTGTKATALRGDQFDILSAIAVDFVNEHVEKYEIKRKKNICKSLN